MSNKLRIEEGDHLIHDGATQRFILVAMCLWSEGTVAPSSGRPPAVWYRPLTGKAYQHFESEAAIPTFVPATEEQMETLKNRFNDWMMKQGEVKLITLNKDDIRL
jgi:hypothetical protein